MTHENMLFPKKKKQITKTIKPIQNITEHIRIKKKNEIRSNSKVIINKKIKRERQVKT